MRMLDEIQGRHFQPFIQELSRIMESPIKLSSALLIAIRMIPMPVPGAQHDAFQIGVARLPTEFTLNLGRTRNEDGRIAQTTRTFSRGNGMASHLAGNFDDVADTEAAPVSQVIDKLAAARERIQGQQVRSSQVHHMDIVADASPVGSRIVSAVDGDLLTLTQGYLQNQRDQMGLRLMGFPAIGSRAGSIEVTEAGVPQAVDAMKPRQHTFHEKLRFSIGIRRVERVILLNGS